MNIPNTLSVSRLVMVPALLLLAWVGTQWIFVSLLVLAFASDALDGVLARGLGQTSALGARLDSLGDFALYMSLPLCAWWLVPEVFLANRWFFAAAALSVFLPAAVAWGKFRRASSYHTRLVKVAALLNGFSVMLLFAGGPEWPFRLAVPFGVVAALEEIAITVALREPRSNVSSLIHVLRTR